MKPQVGQLVRAKTEITEDYPEHDFKITHFTRRQKAFIAGIVSYTQGGPLRYLVLPAGATNTDWVEFSSSEFFRKFSLVR